MKTYAIVREVEHLKNKVLDGSENVRFLRQETVGFLGNETHSKNNTNPD